MASLRLAMVFTLGLGASGCAVTGPMGSMFAKSKGEPHAEAGDVTGSIARPASVSTAELPQETDLVFTRMAVVDVLKRGTNEISAPWENPSSGAHGTVTPIASAYGRDGMTCRDFLASYLRRQGAETWMQGEACRAKQGAWEVKSLRPWSRS
jgi:surface antigen